MQGDDVAETCRVLLVSNEVSCRYAARALGIVDSTLWRLLPAEEAPESSPVPCDPVGGTAARSGPHQRVVQSRPCNVGTNSRFCTGSCAPKEFFWRTLQGSRAGPFVYFAFKRAHPPSDC